MLVRSGRPHVGISVRGTLLQVRPDQSGPNFRLNKPLDGERRRRGGTVTSMRTRGYARRLRRSLRLRRQCRGREWKPGLQVQASGPNLGSFELFETCTVAAAANWLAGLTLLNGETGVQMSPRGRHSLPAAAHSLTGSDGCPGSCSCCVMLCPATSKERRHVVGPREVHPTRLTLPTLVPHSPKKPQSHSWCTRCVRLRCASIHPPCPNQRIASLCSDRTLGCLHTCLPTCLPALSNSFSTTSTCPISSLTTTNISPSNSDIAHLLHFCSAHATSPTPIQQQPRPHSHSRALTIDHIAPAGSSTKTVRTNRLNQPTAPSPDAPSQRQFNQPGTSRSNEKKTHCSPAHGPDHR